MYTRLSLSYALIPQSTDTDTSSSRADEIDAAVALIKAFKKGSHDPSTTDAELWAAKELIECRIHPDTGWSANFMI